MAKDYGKFLTRLFVMPAWWMSGHLVKAAVRDLAANGWEVEGGGRSDFRCLTMFDADINPLRRMARKNPGLILVCLTVTGETDDIDVHLGIGGTWLKKTSEVFEAIGLGRGQCPRDYVHTMSTKPASAKPARKQQQERPRKAHEKKQVATRKPRTQRAQSRRARTATTVPVSNRLVFHGLPGEVERCRALAIDVLPGAERAATKFNVSGSESYASGTLEFTTGTGLALKAFNRLVAQVPAISVSLEYDDFKTGQRRLLRAIDGRVIEHKVISPSTGPRENRQRKHGKGR